jgi:F-type H+-transporting ATPase subunit delta
MKDLTVLVSRYTKSLYSLAKEQSIVPAVYKDLSKLNEALEASGKYKDIALNPKVPARTKAAIWGVLMDPIKVNGITAMFIKLMLDNSRIHLFPKVIRKYQDMVLADSGIKGVKLYTSVKLSKAESAEITDKLEALLDSKVELESIVEPALIGGMIAKFDSYMIDASIRSKLNKIKTELLSN